MKISMIKLKSRGYLIGNIPLLSLFVLTLCFLSVCLNILPEAATQLLSELPEKSQSLAVSGISLSVIFVLLFFLSLFDMGIHRFFLRKAQRKGGKVKDLFYYFSPSESLAVLSFFIRYKAMSTLLYAVSFAPFSVCVALLLQLLKGVPSLGVSLVMLCTAVLLFFTGAFFLSEVKASLFLVKYRFINGAYLNFRQLVSASQNEMLKHKKTVFSLKVSFLWWFLSCLLILPSLYVFLYYSQSKAVLAAEIMEE